MPVLRCSEVSARPCGSSADVCSVCVMCMFVLSHGGTKDALVSKGEIGQATQSLESNNTGDWWEQFHSHCFSAVHFIAINSSPATSLFNSDNKDIYF